MVGRLTRDPDVKYLQSGTAVANFTLAVDRTFKNKDGEREADFIPIVAWRKTAELCEKYLAKGSQVAVSGPDTNKILRCQRRDETLYNGSCRR